MAKRTGTYHDWKKTSKAFSYAFVNAGKKMTDFAGLELAIFAEDFLGELDASWPHSSSYTNVSVKNGVLSKATARFGGDRTHPWYSGQLHDSVAVRIANKNRTLAVRYMPPSPDTGKPQHMSASDGMKVDHIIGTEWARTAIHNAEYFFLPGLQIQLVVGVPYAEKVNESARHSGFFEIMTEDLVNKVDDYLLSGVIKRTRLVADDKGVKVTKSKGIY